MEHMIKLLRSQIVSIRTELMEKKPPRKFHAYYEDYLRILKSVKEVIDKLEDWKEFDVKEKATLKMLLFYAEEKIGKTRVLLEKKRYIDDFLKVLESVDHKNCELYNLLIDLELDFSAPVFTYICYADPDYERVKPVSDFLKEVGVDVFFSEKGLFKIGEELDPIFLEKLRKAELILSFISKNSKTAEKQKWEINEACEELKKRRGISGIVIDSSEPGEPFSNFWWYNIRKNKKKLVSELPKELGKGETKRRIEKNLIVSLACFITNSDELACVSFSR